MNRNEVIAEIKSALKQRSGRVWSVTGGTGTTYGWLKISVPPSKRCEFGYIPDADRAELAKLLDLKFVHQQGVDVPSSNAYYQEFIDRAHGRPPSKIGEPYWD